MDGLRATVLTTDSEIAELEPAWAELHAGCAEATPFQSWAWLYSWWEHYGEGRRLHVIALWQGDALVGLLPLVRERFGLLRRLVFLGTGITDHLDMLVRAEFRLSAVEAAIDTLMLDRSWHVIDLHELRSDAVAWDLVRRWAGSRFVFRQNDCPVIDASSPEATLPALSRNHRSSLRRTLRRAESEGVVRALAEVTDAEVAGRNLVKLHRQMWEERSIVPEHLTARFEGHLAAAARRLSAAGLGAVSEFRRDGRVILSSFLMFGGGLVSTYLQGASRDVNADYQVSSLYIWDALHLARDKHLAGVSLLRGREPYKLRWNPRIATNQRVILGHNAITWAPYCACQLLHTSVRSFADSERAPRWVAWLASRYRARRRRVGPTSHDTSTTGLNVRSCHE